MKVSVCIITFNHRSFIAQALDSILMQETDFVYEILIGDDGSTDGTRGIVEDYARLHPDLVRLLPQGERGAGEADSRPTSLLPRRAMRNLANLLEHAEGEYIALLEGDDDWLSSEKLQIQTDFLDKHVECSTCFHGAQTVYADGVTPSSLRTPPGPSLPTSVRHQHPLELL